MLVQGYAKGIDRLGQTISPEVLKGTRELFIPLHERGRTIDDVAVTRDVEYGPDPRHRLDIFRPVDANDALRPVLVFVPGGGFVGGNKREAETPFYDNVGIWAARHGIIGVTINYRLAPRHPWPSGAEDVAGAVAWLVGHISKSGGNPDAVFLMGHSAGAVHAGAYVAQGRFQRMGRPEIAGCILLSGFFDNHAGRPNPAYFGDDPSKFAEQSSLPGLGETGLPLLIAAAEYDPPFIQNSAVAVLTARLKTFGRMPPFALLAGHNHYSAVMHINISDDVFEKDILKMVQREASGRPHQA